MYQLKRQVSANKTASISKQNDMYQLMKRRVSANEMLCIS